MKTTEFARQLAAGALKSFMACANVGYQDGRDVQPPVGIGGASVEIGQPYFPLRQMRVNPFESKTNSLGVPQDPLKVIPEDFVVPPVGEEEGIGLLACAGRHEDFPSAPSVQYMVSPEVVFPVCGPVESHIHPSVTVLSFVGVAVGALDAVGVGDMVAVGVLLGVGFALG